MTLENILEIATWTEPYRMTFDVFSNAFKKDIKVIIVFEKEDGEARISKITLDTIDEFLALKEEDIDIINAEIWQHCLQCNQGIPTSFDGGKTWVESKLEDNLAECGIKTKEDALEKSSAEHIFISNNWGVESRVFWLSVSNNWDGYHGIIFTYINGKLDSVS
jgi:hypothetical protein